jgi:hypothetical protein
VLGPRLTLNGTPARHRDVARATESGLDRAVPPQLFVEGRMTFRSLMRAALPVTSRR